MDKQKNYAERHRDSELAKNRPYLSDDLATVEK